MAPTTAAAPESNDESSTHSEELNLAQIMTDLRKGEKTADVLESNLSNLEKKIDDLLASFEESERLKVSEGSKKNPKLSEDAEPGESRATSGKP